MPDISIRHFQRRDRDQVTNLVNAHLAAVLPGLTVSVNTVLSQFEREPDEPIVDPWVAERAVLVAEQRRNVVAAAYLVRYADEERVNPSYRGTAEIKWLLCWPSDDDVAAGRSLLTECVAQLTRWQARAQYANGDLPAPAAYGVPHVWPHIAALLAEAGFAGGREEQVCAVRVADLPRDVPTAASALRIVRSVAPLGTRFEAWDRDRRRGYVDVDTLLTYLDPTSDPAERAFIERLGFTRMTTTRRGLVRPSPPPGRPRA